MIAKNAFGVMSRTLLATLTVIGPLVATTALAQSQVAPPPRPMTSLKGVPVPLPSNLDEFVKDREAAILLGKALFWDMQAGSDGKTACASCHWHAGADARFVNTLAPANELRDTQPVIDPLAKLTRSSFPFIKRENVDPNDPTDPFLSPTSVITDRNAEVLGSQGVQTRDFVRIHPWRARETGRIANDPIFSVHGTNLRAVTSRNSPTVINAVFNHRQNWDGSASFFFNGVNKFGKADPDARVYQVTKTYGTTRRWVFRRVGSFFRWVRQNVQTETDKLEKVSILMDNAALASQAVDPPLSTEMAWLDRPFPEFGRKMLVLRPLAQQRVYFTDSVLSPYAVYFGRGLWVDYRTLVRQAFQDKWWNSRVSTEDGYTLMEANFSLFWGLSLLMYQSTLVSDDSPLDRFLEGDTSAISQAAQVGKFIFEGNGDPRGGCNICHSGPEMTAASIGEIVLPDGNQRNVTIMTRRAPGVQPTFTTPFDIPTLYDRGFYNLGISKTTEDLANGGSDDFGPFSPTFRAANGEDVDQVGPEIDIARNRRMPFAINGTFKTPTLRNVELTGPFNHNGGRLTLEDVMKFYARGSDFNLENGSDLDQGVSGIPPLADPSLGGVPALVEFMKTMTDDRVRFQSDVFDHPEIILPNGFIRANGDDLVERTLTVPAVGRFGVQSFFWGTLLGTEFRPAEELVED